MQHTRACRRAIDQIMALLPAGVAQLGGALETALSEILMQWCRELDVVTREELEVQQAILQRTQERLEDLERRVRGTDPVS